MHTTRQNLFTRDDTFFGACEGLGQDLPIPANLLRLGFTLGLFFHPVAALGAYLGTGILVLLSRLLVPEPRQADAPAVGNGEKPAADAQPAAEAVDEPMPLAA